VSGHLGLVCNWLLFGGPFCKTTTYIIYVIRLFSKEICIIYLMSTVYASHITQLFFAIIKCCLIFNFFDEIFIQRRSIAHSKHVWYDFEE